VQPPRRELAGPLPDTLQNQERKIIETALAKVREFAGQKVAAAKLGIPALRWTRKFKQLTSRSTSLSRSNSRDSFLTPKIGTSGFSSSIVPLVLSVSAPCMWPPCCIFVNRELRWRQCSNATADWAKQHNDDLEDRAVRCGRDYVFTISGRMEAEQVAELKELSDTELPKASFSTCKR